jgi:photosystem II stability/assembly factor-like uncharacterized protein
VSIGALVISKRVLADDQGCVPVWSAAKLAARSDPSAIDSLIGSSSIPGRVYASTRDRRLYVGEGTPLRWRPVSTRIPGTLVAALGRPETIYAAQRALYKSNDRGSSWTRLSCGLILRDVAISPSEPSTIYLAADTVDHATRVLGGLYRTTNGGQSWERLTNFPKPNPHEPVVDNVAVDPESPEVVFIGRPVGGILRSADGGGHWTFSRISRGGLGLDGLPLRTIAFGPGAHPILLVGSYQGVWRSDSTGRSWVRAGPVRSPSDRVTVVVPDPLDRKLLFGISDGGVPVRTVDGGRHWSRMTGLPPTISSLVVAKADRAVYAVDWSSARGGRSIVRSRDHGLTWTRLTPFPKRP